MRYGENLRESHQHHSMNEVKVAKAHLPPTRSQYSKDAE